MSIEKLLSDLIEAVNANTAALNAAGGKSASASKGGDKDDAAEETRTTTRGRKTKTDDSEAEAKTKPKKITREDLTALLNKVKEDLGAPVAKKLIKDVGGVERLAEVDDDDIKELYEAAEKKLAAAAGSSKDKDDDGL